MRFLLSFFALYEQLNILQHTGQNDEHALGTALDQIQCQVLIFVEAVGGTDHGSPNQDVAQELIRNGRRVAQDPASEDLPGAARQQCKHGNSHEETHDVVQNLIQFFHKIISLRTIPPGALRTEWDSPARSFWEV